MTHFAKVSELNIVEKVLVMSDGEPLGKTRSFLNSISPGRWIKTSYTGIIRKNYAPVGGEYHADIDAFSFRKPEGTGWVFDRKKAKWGNDDSAKNVAKGQGFK